MKRSYYLYYLYLLSLWQPLPNLVSLQIKRHITSDKLSGKRPVTVEYTITNTGNQPLVLTNVTTSCACAVADWTKEPIAPGGKD